VLLLGTTRSYISNRLPPPPKKNHSGSYITQHHHLHSDTMPLLTLPVEIIFMIARLLTDDQGEVCFADLDAFLQANSILNGCLDYSLWHEAVASPSAAERVFTHLIRTDDLANLKFFLELGADIEMNLPDARSETCRRTTSHPMVCTVLHVAAQFDRVKIARFLLEHGVTVVHYDKRNRPSYNAIHDARSAEMLQLLLDHNADFEQQVIKLHFDGDGYRPLHYYAMRSDVQAIGEFRLAGFRRVLGVKLREVLMPKLYKKRRTSSGEVSTQGFFREVWASKLREVLPLKPGENPPV
jgi:hypothetical protein